MFWYEKWERYSVFPIFHQHHIVFINHNLHILIWSSVRPQDFHGGSDGKESAYKVGDLGSIPGSGRSPGGGHGNLFQYSCLENPMDRGAWKATDHGVAKSQTRPIHSAHSKVWPPPGISSPSWKPRQTFFLLDYCVFSAVSEMCLNLYSNTWTYLHFHW